MSLNKTRTHIAERVDASFRLDFLLLEFILSLSKYQEKS